jgi:hypothetical protein
MPETVVWICLAFLTVGRSSLLRIRYCLLRRTGPSSLIIFSIAFLTTVFFKNLATAEAVSIMDRVIAQHENETSTVADIDFLLRILAEQPPRPVNDSTGSVVINEHDAISTAPAEISSVTGSSSMVQQDQVGTEVYGAPMYLMPSSTVSIAGPQLSWVGSNAESLTGMPTITSMQQEHGKQFFANNSSTSLGNVFGAINLGATGVESTFGDLSTQAMGAVNSGQINISIGVE